MCRNIKVLFIYEPPATQAEIQATAFQYIRKISGFAKPSAANAKAFGRAVDEVAKISSKLLRSLETSAPPKDRDVEAAKAHARAVRRFGTSNAGRAVVGPRIRPAR
jgi:hypothetical protein